MIRQLLTTTANPFLIALGFLIFFAVIGLPSWILFGSLGAYAWKKTKKPAKHTCPHCEHTLPGDGQWTYCPHCGDPIASAPISTGTPNGRHPPHHA